MGYAVNPRRQVIRMITTDSASGKKVSAVQHHRDPVRGKRLLDRADPLLFLMRLDKKDSRRTGLREPAIFHVFLMLSRVDPQQRFVVQRSCFTTREQAEF
jgi:hypothetical protein